MKHRVWVDRSILILAVWMVVVPFAGRAVYMDEHIFLKIAGNVFQNPLFPQDVSSVFFGMDVPDFAAHTHPPVGAYALAAATGLAGHEEYWLRLLFSIFPISAILAFYSLAQRWTAHPLEVSLLFAVSPAFAVMAPTLMMDIPMLAFLLCGFALYFQHVSGRRFALVGAAFCFILAAGTGYTALIPLFTFGVAILLWGRPWKEAAAVLATPVALGLWLLAMTAHFGRFPLIQTAAYFVDQGSVGFNLIAAFSFIGGVAMLPGAFVVLFRPGGKALLTCVVISIVAAFWIPADSLGYRLWFGFLMWSGLGCVSAFVTRARAQTRRHQSGGESFLLLWFPAVMAFFVVVGDMINARYVLLGLPALFLVVFRSSPILPLRLTIGLTAALSILVSSGDVQFVNAYPRYVNSTIVPIQKEGFRLWGATESGLRYYLEQSGVPPLTSKDLRPTGMDLIVRPETLFRYGVSAEIETMLSVLQRDVLTIPLPIRTFNLKARAGFHDSRIGLVPYTWSRAPIDTLEIAQIHPLVQSLPQPEPGTVPRPEWTPDGPMLYQTVPELVFPLKIPSSARLQYEADGNSVVETSEGMVRLLNRSATPVTWRSFRVVPASINPEKP